MLSEKHRSGDQQTRVIQLKIISYAKKTAAGSRCWHTHPCYTPKSAAESRNCSAHTQGLSEWGLWAGTVVMHQTLLQWRPLKFGTQQQGCFGTYTVHGRTACSTLAERPMASSIARRCKQWMAQWQINIWLIEKSITSNECIPVWPLTMFSLLSC